MRQPGRRCRWVVGSLLLAMAASPLMAAPKTPPAAVQISLTKLGFPGYSAPFLDSGSSMLTVHFADDTHLLVTFSTRGLLERLPDDPKEDEDRAVAALLIELPSGKVLARTRWRLHDHSQYLWALGKGRFLLRVRTTLVAMAPLANLGSDDPFRQTPFAKPAGQIDAILVSPDSEMVTIESSKRRKQVQGMSKQDLPPLEQVRAPELITFARVLGTGTPEDPVRAMSAGAVRAENPVLVPLNGRGYMYAERGQRSSWAMGFQEYDGPEHKLPAVMSSCAPRMQLVSPSQFVVISCRGDVDHMMLSAYDFSAHEVWEEPMGGIQAFSFMAYAPEAGRFAMNRATSVLSMVGSVPTTTTTNGATNVPQEQLGSQEVRVYQTESGDLLLKVPCTPILRAGQNFDISPDGMQLAAVRGLNVEVFKLPPLSAADRRDLADVKRYEPATNTSARVVLQHLTQQVGATDVAAGEQQEAAAAASVANVPVPVSAPVASAGAQGTGGPRKGAATAPVVGGAEGGADGAAPDAAPRKPPTLLGAGEKTEIPQPKQP